MEKCIVSVQTLSHKQMKMNDDKTEFLVISYNSIARSIVSPALHRGDHHVVATSTARNIGVIIDLKASMEPRVFSVWKSSFIHIRNLSMINKFLDSSSLDRVYHQQHWLLLFPAMWCAIYTYQQATAHPEHCTQDNYWAWKVWTHHTNINTAIPSLAASSTKDTVYDTCPGFKAATNWHQILTITAPFICAMWISTIQWT